MLNLPATFVESWAEEQMALLGKHFGFSAQRPSQYYEVRLGDSLSEIAERHGTGVAKLLALNRLKSADEIHAGQTLRVPLTSDPKPLGVGSAALLATQRVSGESEGDGVDLPRLIAAVVGEDGQLDPAARMEGSKEPLASDTCRAGVIDGSRAAPAYLTGNDAEPSALLTEIQPDLAADPADYGIAPDGTIEIQIGETLGHYADWLQRPSDRIRTLNGLGENTRLIVGRRLKLDFSTVSAGSFEARRIDHHKTRQLRYFRGHRIKGVIEHPIIAGDNLWLLSVKQYGIPLWLLRQYNPDVNVDTTLSLGSILFVPFVEALPDEPTCAVAQVEAYPGGDDTRPSAASGKGVD
jgi:membrane-bound lytic murein transglycosylase D